MNWEPRRSFQWIARAAGLGPDARAIRVACAVFIVSAGSAGCARPTTTQRAMALVRQHREADAIRLLRESIARYPDDVAARRLLVRVLGVDGDLAAAKLEATELGKRLPEGDPSAWIELGHALELAHRFEDALGAYDTAARTSPRSPAGPREGGMRCARWGEVEEALPRLEEAAQRGANDAEFWHALGLVRLHSRDYDGAERAYHRGLAVDPSAIENLLGLATVAVARGDASAALRAYDALATRRPEYAAAEVGRAWALARLGRSEEAETALERAASLGASPAIIAKQRVHLRE